MTHPTLTRLLAQKPFLKVIAGIENFNAEEIRTVAQAAQGNAVSIDLSVHAESVKWVKANTDLLVFVSSLSPAELADSLEWGTDLVELGNFAPIYERGALISPEMVLQWTRELTTLIQGRVPVCVTVPGVLDLQTQIDLARQIEAAGADLLQIENISGDLSHVAAIREAVGIPVLVSGKLHAGNLTSAIATGAQGIGVGAAIRAGGDLNGMKAILVEIASQLQAAAVI
ncbi:MAG: DUF561 domain-containing protein [Candidatus Sericytochromatia bacterium]|nr:DUF561 domain-containing protein [Candidatus Sericytochromatia bacterium]